MLRPAARVRERTDSQRECVAVWSLNEGQDDDSDEDDDVGDAYGHGP